jgi:hypothetical protein
MKLEHTVSLLQLISDYRKHSMRKISELALWNSKSVAIRRFSYSKQRTKTKTWRVAPSSPKFIL